MKTNVKHVTHETTMENPMKTNEAQEQPNTHIKQFNETKENLWEAKEAKEHHINNTRSTNEQHMQIQEPPRKEIRITRQCMNTFMQAKKIEQQTTATSSKNCDNSKNLHIFLNRNH